ncbi:MAG: leucyl/phenylalanyl-tRNA--protein transferase [Rhodobacteraceae bacterium]|nr:MAG: leucyl/phenylalanyl-tRNA--protein transferase [Paracoccaceae bacterium]
MDISLTQQIILAYSQGSFPMGTNKRSSKIEWVRPIERGLIPIGSIHCSKSLRKEINRKKFVVSFDTSFAEVIANCADREESWINRTILDQYLILHSNGLAHSVEIRQNNDLVGGLYGLELGAVFFAESMFSKVSNTSKLAMIAMMARVHYGGFKIFDTQFPSTHLTTLGGITVDQLSFQEMLSSAIKQQSNFNRSPKLSTWEDFLSYGCK